MSKFIIALALTCALTCIAEVIPLLFFGDRCRLVKTSVLCNVVTNPVLNVIVAMVLVYTNSYAIYYIVLVLLEILVLLVEGLYYKHFCEIKLKRALLISLLANIVSFVVGTIVNETGLMLKILPV